MTKDPLNIRQRSFLNNLLSKEYKTQGAAYIAAGYKAKPGNSAETKATQLVKNSKFKAEYEKVMAKASKKTELTAERVLREDSRIAFADIAEIFKGETLIQPSELPEDIRRAISGIEVIERLTGNNGDKEIKYKYRFWDKGKSLERLGRHLKLYDEKSGNLVINIFPPSINKPPPKQVISDTEYIE